MFFLCLCILFFQNVASDDATTMSNSTENSDIFIAAPSTSETFENRTKSDTNNTTLMERITQPSQSQQIERTLAPISINSSLKAAGKKEISSESFRPSPQLETYYEHNKYPVKPAVGEAKTFGGFADNGHYLNSWTERPPVPPWIEKQHSQWSESQNRPSSWNENSNIGSNPWVDKPTTQQTWVSRVKFPTTSYGSSNERPYKFVTNEEKSSNFPPANFPTTNKEDFSFNKPVETHNRNTKPSDWFWDKLLGNTNKKKTTTEPIQKTFFDYNLLEKPPLHTFSKEPLHGLSSGSNPWQSVIKILTTIIPIGLLISALTPTVITVTSVNDTQSRYRVDDPVHHGIVSRLASSLNYVDKLNNSNCRDKVLCELLVSASSSKDSEQHIENLLGTFAENEDLKSKKEDLLKVFEAVKNEDCSSILCKSTKHPT